MAAGKKGASFDNEVRALADEVLCRAGAPGATIALVVDGTLRFCDGVGYRDLARKEQMPDEALFYIYSVTKVMIAAAILQLVERGLFDLEESIQHYVPDLPFATPATLRQVLNHSAGIADYGALAAYQQAVRANPRQPWSRSQFLANTVEAELLYAPGQGWAYSNIGYMLLAMALEKHYRMPLGEVLQRELFAPLGLRHTYVARSLAGVEALAPGFTTFFNGEDRPDDVRFLYHPGWVAHGLVVSTALELAMFMQALFDGPVLNAGTLQAMCRPQSVPGEHRHFRQPAYGLGLMLDPQSDHGLTAGHAGGGPGYATAAFHFSNVRGMAVTCTALVNHDQGEPGLEIAFALADLIATRGQV